MFCIPVFCHRRFVDEGHLSVVLPFVLLPLHTAGHDGTPEGSDLLHIPNLQPETVKHVCYRAWGKRGG